MRRIILALVTSIAALSLAAYATRAVWSSSVTVTNNKIITGTANLQVSTDGGSTYGSSAISSSPISNLIPGKQDSIDVFKLSNEGGTTGLNFNISAQILSVSSTPGASLDMSKLQLSIYDSTASANGGVASSGWFSVSDWQSASRSLNSFLVQNVLPDRSHARPYTLAARLLSAADNTWQGQTVTIVWTVTGTQPAGAF